MIPSHSLQVVSNLPDHNFDLKEKVAGITKQQTLFRVSHKGNNFDMGYFFEMLTGLLFNGKVGNPLYIKKKQFKAGEFHPDVVNKEDNIMIESKSVIINAGHLSLYDHQVEKYEAYQFYNKTDIKIYWVIFIHNLRKSKSFKGNKRDMFRVLGKYTHAGIIMPFSLIHKIWKNDWKSSLLYRYDKGRHHDVTCIRQKGLKAFVADPIKAVGAMGIDRSQFTYHKTMIPEDVIIAEQPIAPFPIIYIKDKDHGAWLKKFKTKLDESSEYEYSKVPF